MVRCKKLSKFICSSFCSLIEYALIYFITLQKNQIGMNDCAELEIRSSSIGRSKDIFNLGRYEKLRHLKNGRPAYKLKGKDDYLYFDSGVWQVHLY